MIPLHLSLCAVAAALTWRCATAVSLALAVVASVTLAAEIYPSLLWQFVGPLAVLWLGRMLWDLSPAEDAIPAVLIALAVAVEPTPSRLAYGLYVAAAHVGVLIACLRALRRRSGPVRHEERLAGALVASSAGGAVGALCWGLWGTADVSAISDVVFVAGVIAASVPWRASASSH